MDQSKFQRLLQWLGQMKFRFMQLRSSWGIEGAVIQTYANLKYALLSFGASVTGGG